MRRTARLSRAAIPVALALLLALAAAAAERTVVVAVFDGVAPDTLDAAPSPAFARMRAAAALASYLELEVLRGDALPAYARLGTSARVPQLNVSARPPYFIEDTELWPACSTRGATASHAAADFLEREP